MSKCRNLNEWHISTHSGRIVELGDGGRSTKQNLSIQSAETDEKERHLISWWSKNK